jgi:hypothetical protein
MKKRSPIWHLKIAAASLGFCGLAFAIGGALLYGYQRDIQEMFESGNWSLKVVLSQLDIRSKADLDAATPREDMLLTAIANTNKQCSSLAETGAEVAIVYAFSGIGMFISALCIVHETRRLKKQIAEHNPAP